MSNKPSYKELEKKVREYELAEQKLRRQAESVVKSRHVDMSAFNEQDKDALIDELRTYQVELEIQNQELRNAQEIVETSRDRFSQLYHLSPVGY
ncbi:MAG: hypothetical protein MI892_00920, partial [Desulfobacterales bacterium]|nr:hypothetical protein [Desulfobacterales bacterium]